MRTRSQKISRKSGTKGREQNPKQKGGIPASGGNDESDKCTDAGAGRCLHAGLHADTYQRHLPGAIMVTLVDGPFHEADHHIDHCNQADTCLVDHLPPLMTLGLPTVEIKSITVSVGGMTYALPSSRMFNPGLSSQSGGLERFAGYCANRFNCAFRARFAEAGGAYAAEWIIRNGVATRTVLSTSIDISTLFSENRMPPRDEKCSLPARAF